MAAVLSGAAALLTGCASSGLATHNTPAGTVTVGTTIVVTQTAAASAPSSATPAGAVASSSATPAADQSFVMPNEVGKNLQGAQDDIQRVSGNPLFFTDSTDASGQGRMQILDSNWKVCSQNVPPGRRVNENSHISFAAVKNWEQCP